MSEQYINLGATFVLSLGLIELLKYAISLLGRKKNGDYYSKEMARELSIISENHLHSIEEAIREQTRQSHNDHQDQIKILTEIRTILSERK